MKWARFYEVISCMFKLNYKQLFSLPVALAKYPSRSWLYEKILVWTVPPVTRDSVVGIFVLSFCFVRHRSSHFLVLYVIISFSIYYYWVRFLQLNYTEPLYGQLQATLDLAYDIRYLSRLVTLSPYILGLFSHICTIGLYLFYAGKSILVMSEMSLGSPQESAQKLLRDTLSGCSPATDLIEMGSNDPVVEAATKFLHLDVKAFQTLLRVKGFGPWFLSVKNSSAGFFPISMTSLIHLQLIKDPDVLKPLREAVVNVPTLLEPEVGWTVRPYPVESSSGYWVSPRVKFWSVFYRAFLTKRFYGMPAKYISFAYLFDNQGTAPFFGRFTNDLELMKVFGHFSFEKFSLLEFFTFSFRTAFRLWIPLFSVGYKDTLAWWIHPYAEFSLMNLFGYSRYIFEPFMIAVSLVLENSIQQIYASFYMDRCFFPVYHFLNQWNKLRPATLAETQNAFFHSLGGANLVGRSLETGSEFLFKPSKVSTFLLTLGGYTVKYAPIYLPCEEARIRTQLLIFEILFFRPFILAFKVFTFGVKIFIWLICDSFHHFTPFIVFDPF